MLSERSVRRPPTARQAELLDRLEELFLAEGFATFTLDELAARLRCSKSTLYALAPSKEQLSVQVVGHFFKKATARIEQRIADLPDVRERIGGYLTAAADELRPATREFIADIAAFPPARATYELNARAAAARIRELIAEGVRLGEFQDVHVALVSEMVGLTIENIHLGTIAKRTGLSDAEAFAALSRFLLSGLAPKR
ncbi:TetR/AcrR family transcriptional regulator [Kutzneria viridogrisea]|uniref:TetR family transcription regulator n=2 Tax=Kutzneria TaxID=43356 RepID=W5VZJ3_9PSEU|nr:TetR/AcrR family transcriptional regulator [Kutzneria albida]AHH93997.1 TetR family transcription regulator [Kutzneria albida DSM 43870]MBA8930998.1 AcrR family transcriptional regulator [Kutzneria viridogrisea]